MHELNIWMQPELVKALCWTLIHSLWLGVVMAFFAGIVVAATRKSTPLLRYNLFVSLLFVFSISIVVVFFNEYRNARDASLQPGATGYAIVSTSYTSSTGTVSEAAPASLQPVIDYFNGQAGWIVMVWTLVFLFQLAKLFAGLHYIHRIRTVKTEPVPLAWQKQAEALARGLGIRQGILFLQSAMVQVPVVVGVMRPVILLPLGMITQLDPKYIEAILLHELAHIRRKDFLVNLLQTFLESFFFFNPAVLWLSSMIREEREACCDDIVIARTADKRAYLQALLSFQEQDPSFAMALQTRKAYLLNRVKRMLTNENKKLNIMERIILISGLMLFSAFALLPAQEVKQIVTPAVPEQPATPPTKVQPVTPVSPIATLEKQAIPAKPERIQVAPAKEIIPAVPPVPAIPAKDTVPGTKSRITSMSTNSHDDGKVRTSVITAITANGQTYIVKRVNNETVLLSVDGKNIPKEEMNQYSEFLDDIESRERKAKEQRAKQQELRMEQTKLRQKQSQLRLEQNKLEQVRRKQERTALNQKKQQEHQVKVAEMNKKTQALQLEQKGKLEKKHVVAVSSRPTEVSGIIDELSRQNLVPSADNLSFTLTDSELIVNGSRQDDALQQRLKEKYNLKAGDSIQYKKTGGSTTTTINRN